MNEPDDEDLRSRTDARLERKSSEERLARLASTLVGLSAKQRGRLELDEALVDELDEAARMPNARALSRQLRKVRRQLRAGDVDTVERAVDRLLNPGAPPVNVPASTSLDPVASWLQRVMGEGSVEVFIAEHPQADRQRLRTLLRNLSKASPKSEPKAKRALMAALRDAMSDT